MARDDRARTGGGRRGPTRRTLIGGAAAASALSIGKKPASAQQAGASAAGGSAAGGAFWPEGARLAIAVTMVVEAGADPAPSLKAPDGRRAPDLFGTTAQEYASREGIPRILDLLDKRKIKATALICGRSAQKFPALAKEIAQRGHECAGHGETHAIQYQMSREEERAFIQGAVDLVKAATGQTPIGYNCRQQARSPNTLSLLQELGFLYHVDDISRDEPFVESVNGAPFAVVPYTQHLTDFSFFNRGNGTAAEFEAELKLEFDQLYAEGATRRRMMSITLHDSIARPSRARAMDNFIAYAQRRKGVWLTRCDAIARYALASPATIHEKTAI